MFTFIFRYILVVILCTICNTCGNTLDQCEQKNDCECMFSSGYRINLKSIGEQTFNVSTTKNETFYFHPCRNVLLGNINCSVCLRMNTSQYVNLGNTGDASFQTMNGTNVYLHFNHSNLTTSIHLLCPPDDKTLFQSVQGTDRYNLQLLSRAACSEPPKPTTPSMPPTIRPHPSSGLSTGSILVIILVVFSGLYFAGGALALKLLRGAEGKEMVPNYDFWVDLPCLVRDGALFVVSGFQPSPTYESI